MGADIPDDTPELPESVAYLWNLYKSIRFSLVCDDGQYTLLARPPLTITDVSAYLSMASIDLDHMEFDVILALDAIFERYRG